CVGFGGLLGSLFVGPGHGGYYFGDYYGARYQGLGFRPWFAGGRGHSDPLFDYYRWHNRSTPGWDRGLYDTYRGRFNGTLARPPPPLVAQNELIRGGRAFNPNRAAGHSLQVVRPLSQVHNDVRLTRLSQPQVHQQRDLGLRYRQASQDRAV